MKQSNLFLKHFMILCAFVITTPQCLNAADSQYVRENCRDYHPIVTIIESTVDILDQEEVNYNKLDQQLDLLNAYCSDTVWKKAGNIYSCGGHYNVVGETRVFVGNKYVTHVRKACADSLKAFKNSSVKDILDHDQYKDMLRINWNLIDRQSNKVGIVE